MLDRQFLRRFFDQLDDSSDEQLAEKIAEIEKHVRNFPKGSEALLDARYLLKHLRRELLQRQFQSTAAPRGD